MQIRTIRLEVSVLCGTKMGVGVPATRDEVAVFADTEGVSLTSLVVDGVQAGGVPSVAVGIGVEVATDEGLGVEVAIDEGLGVLVVACQTINHTGSALLNLGFRSDKKISIPFSRGTNSLEISCAGPSVIPPVRGS
jgi:hypothetical protein